MGLDHAIDHHEEVTLEQKIQDANPEFLTDKQKNAIITKYAGEYQENNEKTDADNTDLYIGKEINENFDVNKFLQPFQLIQNELGKEFLDKLLLEKMAAYPDVLTLSMELEKNKRIKDQQQSMVSVAAGSEEASLLTLINQRGIVANLSDTMPENNNEVENFFSQEEAMARNRSKVSNLKEVLKKNYNSSSQGFAEYFLSLDLSTLNAENLNRIEGFLVLQAIGEERLRGSISQLEGLNEQQKQLFTDEITSNIITGITGYGIDHFLKEAEKQGVPSKKSMKQFGEEYKTLGMYESLQSLEESILSGIASFLHERQDLRSLEGYELLRVPTALRALCIRSYDLKNPDSFQKILKEELVNSSYKSVKDLQIAKQLGRKQDGVLIQKMLQAFGIKSTSDMQRKSSNKTGKSLEKNVNTITDMVKSGIATFNELLAGLPELKVLFRYLGDVLAGTMDMDTFNKKLELAQNGKIQSEELKMIAFAGKSETQFPQITKEYQRYDTLVEKIFSESTWSKLEEGDKKISFINGKGSIPGRIGANMMNVLGKDTYKREEYFTDTGTIKDKDKLPGLTDAFLKKCELMRADYPLTDAQFHEVTVKLLMTGRTGVVDLYFDDNNIKKVEPKKLAEKLAATPEGKEKKANTACLTIAKELSEKGGIAGLKDGDTLTYDEVKKEFVLTFKSKSPVVSTTYPRTSIDPQLTAGNPEDAKKAVKERAEKEVTRNNTTTVQTGEKR